jgi:hypothetical protein
MELLEWLAGIDAEFRDEHLPGPVERKQRLSLTPRPIQGQHQLVPEDLSEGMTRRQHLQLADNLCVAADRQVRFQPLLQGTEPEVF